MPLIPGPGKKTFKQNLMELSSSKAQPRPLKQRLAIAYSEQNKKPKRG